MSTLAEAPTLYKAERRNGSEVLGRSAMVEAIATCNTTIQERVGGTCLKGHLTSLGQIPGWLQVDKLNDMTGGSSVSVRYPDPDHQPIFKLLYSSDLVPDKQLATLPLAVYRESLYLPSDSAVDARPELALLIGPTYANARRLAGLASFGIRPVEVKLLAAVADIERFTEWVEEAQPEQPEVPVPPEVPVFLSRSISHVLGSYWPEPSHAETVRPAILL